MLGIKEVVKEWTEYQTDTLGLDIDEGELVEKFNEVLDSSIVATEAMLKENGAQLTPEQEREFQEWQRKADVLAKNQKEVSRWQGVLGVFWGSQGPQTNNCPAFFSEVSPVLD